VCKLSQEHLSVLLLVVELQALVEVLEASLVLVLFALGEDGKELVELDLLLVCKKSNENKNLQSSERIINKINALFFLVPPSFSMVAQVGFRLRARRRSPRSTASMPLPSLSKMEKANSAPGKITNTGC